MSGNMIITIVIGLIIVALIYLFFTKRRKHGGRDEAKNAISELGKPEEEKESKASLKDGVPRVIKAPLLCRVADNQTGTIYNADVPADALNITLHKYGTLGRLWKRDSKDVYGLNKLRDGSYLPIIPPRTMENPPGELHNKIHLPRLAVPIVYDMSEEKTFIEKYGQIIWWVAVMAFIGFLYMSGGG